MPEVILVVDDDAMARALLADALEQAGHQVVTAEHGAAGLDVVRARADITVVVSDMNMPVLDGLGFIKGLRAGGHRTPVVVLTADDDMQRALEAIHSGANDYLLKDPNIHETVVFSVNRLAERARLERTIRSTAAHLDAIVSNLAEGLLVVDAEGDVVRENPALAQLVRSGGRAEVVALVRQISVDLPLAKADIDLGNGRVGAASASAIVGDDGDWMGAVALVRDTTHEREIDRMKSEFVSVASHELRTPLTSVLGFAKLALSRVDVLAPHVPPTDKKAARALLTVRKNLDIVGVEGDRMLRLINDMLDVAKLESGRVEWQMGPVDVAALCQRAAEASRALFDEGVHLELAVPDGLPELEGDTERLLQVLVNLLSNAAKFTDHGAVTLHAGTEGGEVELAVKDTGPGIPPDDLDRIFEKYAQVAGQAGVMGTGLGLPICREIVAHHGGRIWAESTVGEGTVLRVRLPV